MADFCDQYQTKLNDITRRANVVVQQYEFITGAAPTAPLEQLQEFQKTVSNLRSSILPKIENDLFTLNNEASDVGCRDVAKRAADTLRQIGFGLSQNLFLLENNLKKTISTVSQRAAETQKATTTQENAGTGASGSSPAAKAGADAANATPTANATGTTAQTGTTTPPAVTPTVGAPTATPSPATGTTTPPVVTPDSGTAPGPAAGPATVATDPASTTARGLPGQKQDARQQATIQDTTNFEQMQDWRVRLCLSPGADYLYKAPEGQRGILDPLSKSKGVVFPYTPTITVSYSATYDQLNPTHSNYKILQYTNSSVDNVTIACDFTAQDTREANYLLAVIHFFRSVTKMWYGQDQFPKPGTPPPLVYLFGMGQFQFNAHPLVVTNFTYTLPADVDYIRAGTPTTNPGVPKAPARDTAPSSTKASDRLKQIVTQIGTNFLNGILPGGESGPPRFTPAGFNAVTSAGTEEPTYVPTKINLQIQCMPVVSRNDVSNRFSLKDYGTGKLLLGTKEKGGGFW